MRWCQTLGQKAGLIADLTIPQWGVGAFRCPPWQLESAKQKVATFEHGGKAPGPAAHWHHPSPRETARQNWYVLPRTSYLTIICQSLVSLTIPMADGLLRRRL